MKLYRNVIGWNGAPTLGMLVSRDSKFHCVTLERSKNGDHPCIPAGIYNVHLGIHHPGSDHSYPVPELETSHINRSHIQIHIANKLEELLGCIAVGQCDAVNAVECSAEAFKRLMAYLNGAFPFKLEIIEP